MRPVVVYNVSLLMGLGMLGAGVFLSFGLGPALMTAGAVLLVLTVYAINRSEV